MVAVIPYERRRRILEEFEKKEIVNLDDFYQSLNGVSKSTIRRDLKTLNDEGQVVLLRGGAAKLKTGSYDTPVNSRSIINIKEKELIAKCAASLVQDGEVIYIDSGTTTLRMLKYLRDKKITLVTTSTMLLAELEGTQVDCTVIGGEVNKATASIVGPITDSTLRDMFFDKAFLGASGYDPIAGINTPDYEEANKKKIVKNNSKKVYVLADSSKDGKVTMCKAFEINECIIIVEKETRLLKEHAQYIVAK